MFIKSNTSLRVWGLGKFKQLILFSKKKTKSTTDGELWALFDTAIL